MRLFAQALLFLFVALALFYLARIAAKGLLPEILRAAFGGRVGIALGYCQTNRFAEFCRRVETLRDAKGAVRLSAALCLLDGRSHDRFDLLLRNQAADIEVDRKSVV